MAGRPPSLVARSSTTVVAGLLLWAISAVSNSALSADTYSYTSFVVPGAGYTAAFGINNRAEIVGAYSDATGSFGFLREPDGNFTKIDLPGGNTGAYAINDVGQVVGAYGAGKGYVRDTDGQITIIDVPSSKLTVIMSINDRGEMVGEYDDANNVRHGFLRHSDGAFTTIDVPGATQTELLGINNKGEIIGSYNDAGSDQHSFL